MRSIWFESTKEARRAQRPALDGDLSTDVLIIGGGMAGILTAHALYRRGIACAVVEAEQIGLGVTQNTTAKITAQHGLIYSKILSTYGLEHAQAYYRANEHALAQYRELAAIHECDFEESDAYVYTTDRPAVLDQEMEAYRKIGIPHLYKRDAPIPVKTAGALGMAHQARFNPLKLLYALAAPLKIYERTRITAVEGDIARAGQWKIRAQHILVSTHFPIVNLRGLYFMKMYQHRSYVIALKGAKSVGAMYIDEREKGHSFRDYKDWLLIGGGDHKTGRMGGGWEELRALAHAAYPAAAEEYAWATQDCMTLDGIPYIGPLARSAPRLYVATGFNKWGMTGSMAAATLLAEQIADGRSDCADTFSPRRRILHPQLLLNGASAIGNLLYPGVRRCTHMGCALRWNKLERTWDCPCHGSRFGEDGHVIENPALRKIRP